MASVKKHLPVLKLLQTAKPKLRKNILSNCDLDVIRTISECVFNTLTGNIPLTESEKQKLIKFRAVLRKILNSQTGLKKKREIVVQCGGAFLPNLLRPIVTAGEKVFNSEQ